MGRAQQAGPTWLGLCHGVSQNTSLFPEHRVSQPYLPGPLTVRHAEHFSLTLSPCIPAATPASSAATRARVPNIVLTGMHRSQNLPPPPRSHPGTRSLPLLALPSPSSSDTYPLHGHLFVTWDSLSTDGFNSPSSYNDGPNTLLHEAFHHLGLLHPWGPTNDQDNSCTDDDYVVDTPTTLGEGLQI